MKRIITISLLIALSAILYAQKPSVRITYYSPEIVRVEKTVGDFRKDPGVSVVMMPQASVSRPKVLVSQDADGYITFKDSRGRVLLSEASSSIEAIEEGLDKGLYKVSQGWRLDKDEPIYGLGMLQNTKMNQRGENRRMIQTNLEDFANVFQSIKGYGVFWDNYSPTDIADNGSVLSLASDVAEEIDYYFIYGGNADGVVAGIRELTGHAPMLPLWTYGFHQSRERYKTQKELLDVVHGYRNAGVPLDGIIQDWQYWGNNYLWNAMEFLNADFPNARKMVEETHDLGAHMSISIWQSFGPQTKPFRELAEKGLLLDFLTWPNSGLAEYWPPRMDYPSGVLCYDAYSKDARDIYWNNLRRLYDLNIDAWWMDSTDPDHNEKPGDLDQPTAMGSWRSVRNIYPLMCVEGVYDHQRAVSSDKRVFILTRSYFTGQQRTGANTWSGDTQSTWDAFRAQIPLCLNYTLTGNPNVNTDIGGFFPGGYNKPATTDVYLPAGKKWYEVSTGRMYNGGQTVKADASLDSCPVFAPAGAILPVAPVMQHSGEKPWDDLEIRVFAGADGKFTLYEDEGDSYNYENGAYSTIEFSLKGRTLTIGSRKGSFPGMLTSRKFHVVFVDAKGSRSKDSVYDGNAITLKFQ